MSKISDAVSISVRWIINLAPLGILGLVFVAISTNGISVFVDYGKLLLVLVGCMLFLALVVNPLIVFLMLKKNPYPLVFRCLKESGITAFFTRSSAANIPVNMELCEELGLDKDVYSVSIPLGATINMDGTCISLVLTGLYLAKMYGVNVPGSALPALALTIILLSLGCPGVPGSGLVCLGIVLNQIGVPISAIGLVIAIDPVLDMFDTMSNTTGDIACATIVSSKEGLLDRKILNDPEAV
jgi:serine/threonine transporter